MDAGGVRTSGAGRPAIAPRNPSLSLTLRWDCQLAVAHSSFPQTALAKQLHFAHISHTMAESNVQVRVETALKKKAEKVFEGVGLNMPTAIRAFLKKVVATRSIPFPLSEKGSPYTFTPRQEREVLEAAQEASQPANLSGPFNTAKDLISHLRRQKAWRSSSVDRSRGA
jgi:addiction module RelB/DinJ family antitoxin